MVYKDQTKSEKQMREIILRFPEQLKEKFEIPEIRDEVFSDVVICGMGGSGAAGDIVTSYVPLSVPVFSHKTYDLPLWVERKTLIITISYSGDTEETISAFEMAIRRNFAVIGVSTGGKIEKIAAENNIGWVRIPDSKIPPRSAAGYLVKAIILILASAGLFPRKNVKVFEALAEKLQPEIFERKCKEIAEIIKGKIPLMYASQKHSILAALLKTKINENAKHPAFSNAVPEMNHNELVGFEDTSFSKNFIAVFIKDDQDNERIKKRFEITKNFLNERSVETLEINLEGETLFEKVFNNMILGDWVSYYLAVAKDVDPLPVTIIDELKKRLY